MILITTAGKVGAEAARLLAAGETPVRVLVRDPQKVTHLADLGVDVATGDLDNASTVDAAMVGISGVILVSQAIPAQELGVIDSAQRHEVKHVVKITSESSLDSPIARRRGQAEIEAGLVASGLGYTLLKSNAYMQNFLMLAPAIAGRNAFGSPTGEGKIGMVDARDVAAVAVEIAAAPAKHASKTYWPTGPESLSHKEAAAVFSEILGRQIDVEPITLDQQVEAMVAAGLPRVVAQDNAKALSFFAQGDADYVNPDVELILGRPARTFDEFVRDYASVFTPVSA